ncbi:carboxymuconolactone decarboxylase family protein [Nitrospinota bacterium]
MSRLADLSTEMMTEEQRRAYNLTTPGQTEVVPGPAGAWLRSPELYERIEWMILFMRHESEIPARLLELAILMTVGSWGSRYPWSRHEPLARKGGLGDDVIAAIAAEKRPEFTNADEEAVYDFCAELRERHSVGDATYQAALEHLGERGLVELVALLGLYTTVSMTVNAFEIPDVD